MALSEALLIRRYYSKYYRNSQSAVDASKIVCLNIDIFKYFNVYSMPDKLKIKVGALKALADETRLSIVEKLSNYPSLQCSELSEKFHLSQPTLSHHFKKLMNADIIIAKKKGTQMLYSLNKKLLKELGILL